MAYGWVGKLVKVIDYAMLAAMVILMVNLSSQLAYFDGNDCGWATHDFETDEGYSKMWILVQVFLLLYVAASHFFNGMKGETVGDEMEKPLSYGRLFYVAFFSVSTGFFLWAAIVPRCGSVNVLTGDQKKKASIDETGKAIAYIVLIVAVLELFHIGATRFGTHSKELGDVARSTTIPTILSYIFGLVGSAALVMSQERVWDPIPDDMPTLPDGTGMNAGDFKTFAALCEGDDGPDKIMGFLPYDIQKSGNVALLALTLVFSGLSLIFHGILLKKKAVTEDKSRGLKGLLLVCEWGFMVCSGLFLSALAAATVNPICVYSHYTMVHGDRAWGVCFVAIGFIMFIMAQNAAYFAGLKVADVGSTLSGLRDNLLA